MSHSLSLGASFGEELRGARTGKSFQRFSHPADPPLHQTFGMCCCPALSQEHGLGCQGSRGGCAGSVPCQGGTKPSLSLCPGRFWFRLYWFPLKVLYATCHSSLQSVPNIPFYFFFNALLLVLTLMNIYWFLVGDPGGRPCPNWGWGQQGNVPLTGVTAVLAAPSLLCCCCWGCGDGGGFGGFRGGGEAGGLPLWNSDCLTPRGSAGRREG